MRILIGSCTYLPAPNGQAIFTTRLAEGLAQRGHEIMVLTQADGPKPERTERNGIPVWKANSVSLGAFYPGVRITLFPDRSFRDVFRDFRPQIVHLQDHYPLSQFLYMGARQHGVPVVGTNHFMPENLAPHIPLARFIRPVLVKFLWRWMRMLYEQLDQVTAPSQTAADIVRRAGIKLPVHPISCGVDTSRFRLMPEIDRQAIRRKYGLHETHKTLIFVGRLDHEKRIDVLLHALAQLKRTDIQLAIVGRGTLSKDLERQSRRLGIEKQIVLTGFVPDCDLPALLNSADIFSMASEAELLSIASLEAMACGKPMLLANSQALPELVDEGSNGYLFEPGNPADAAEKLNLLIQRETEWAALGAASLQKVQHHSLENTLRRYEEIYDRLVLIGPRSVHLSELLGKFSIERLLRQARTLFRD